MAAFTFFATTADRPAILRTLLGLTGLTWIRCLLIAKKAAIGGSAPARFIYYPASGHNLEKAIRAPLKLLHEAAVARMKKSRLRSGSFEGNRLWATQSAQEAFARGTLILRNGLWLRQGAGVVGN